RDVVGRCCREADEPRVEVVNDGLPAIVYRAVALVSNHQIKRRWRKLGVKVLHCLKCCHIQVLRRIEVGGTDDGGWFMWKMLLERLMRLASELAPIDEEQDPLRP